MFNLDGVEFAYKPNVMWRADDEFIFAREPTLRRMPDGSLISMIYTGGPCEPHSENVAAIIRSEDDGATWSHPEVVFKHPARATWGTEIFIEGDRPCAIFQTFCADTNYEELRSFMAYTEDSGRTWNDMRTVPGVPANFSTRQGKVLSDGSWIFPVYWVERNLKYQNPMPSCLTHQDYNYVSGVIRSIDNGKTFSLFGSLSAPGRVHAWEPEITELSTPGHLKMYVRYNPNGTLWESESCDYGKTWTSLHEGSVPSPGTKMVVFKIRGLQVLINNVCSPGRQMRDCLEIWISDDDCKTWSHKLPLAKLVGDINTWSHFWDPKAPLPQVAYPHGFADDEKEILYIAIDSVREFFMLKVPYADIVK